MFMACSLEVMYLCFHSRDMVLSYGQTPIPCNKLPSKFLWKQKCLYVAFAYAFSKTWYDWESTWNGVRASHRYAKFFPVAAKCFSALHILSYLALKCLYVALYICFLPDLLRSGKHLA